MKKFKVKDKEDIPSSAYGKHYQGIEDIFLETDGKEILLFTNKLALCGGWLNSHQIENIIKTYPVVINSGDKINIKSYKLRTLDKNFLPNGSPDVSWGFEIE